MKIHHKPFEYEAELSSCSERLSELNFMLTNDVSEELSPGSPASFDESDIVYAPDPGED